MDKKTKTILLVVIAILVWGYSALEWINYAEVSNNNELTSSSSVVPIISPLKLKPKGDKKLILDYRDPFLNSFKRKVVKEMPKKMAPSNQDKIKTNVPKPEVLKWPEIIYSGVINNKLGLLKINGKDYIVKEGDIKENIYVVKILSERIILEFNDLAKEILKKN